MCEKNQNYDNDRMILLGFEEKKRLLEELQREFGKDASLECVLEKLSQEERLPIELCKFTGLAVYNYYESAGESSEFTGTIKEILKELGIDLPDEDYPIEELSEMFCQAEYWTDSVGSNGDMNVRCVPIDRAVTEEEVTAYLRQLEEEEEEEE